MGRKMGVSTLMHYRNTESMRHQVLITILCHRPDIEARLNSRVEFIVDFSSDLYLL